MGRFRALYLLSFSRYRPSRARSSRTLFNLAQEGLGRLERRDIVLRDDDRRIF